MTRHEFLNKLAVELGRLPKNEVEDILAYYNEYFDEAGPDNEARVIQELGNPAKIATQLKADYAVKQLDRMPRQNNQPGGQPPKRRVPVVLWVVLGIFAAPVALPVAIVAGVLAIVLFIVLGAIILSALITVGAVFAAGIVCVVAGVAALFVDFANAMVILGLGLATVGAMLLLGMVIILGSRALFRFIARKANERRQKERRQKEMLKTQEEGGGENE